MEDDDSAVFEIQDFSVASSWEALIGAIEDAVRTWHADAAGGNRRTQGLITKEVALTIHNTTHVRLVRKTLGRPFYIYISAFQEGEPDVGVAEMWPLALGLYAQPLGLYPLFFLFGFHFPFAPACGS